MLSAAASGRIDQYLLLEQHFTLALLSKPIKGATCSHTEFEMCTNTIIPTVPLNNA